MAGYSETPLQKKLGIKEGMSLFLVNAPIAYFEHISPLPKMAVIKSRVTANLDFIHAFCSDKNTFESEFLRCKKNLKRDGMLWISWPKKSSKVETDLDENIIREFGLKNGLVDVKVCAVDEIWSGLKFVYRVKDR